MGSNACNGLCEKTSIIQPFQDHFLPTQTLIPCQVCNVQLDEKRFKQHIDQQHFCQIFENSQGLFKSRCLLCDYQSTNLQQQSNHIAEKHNFVKITKKTVDRKAIASSMIDEKQQVKTKRLFKNIKKNIVKLPSSKQFQILTAIEDNTIEASIKGSKFTGQIYTKQYRGLQFEEALAEGQLIWYNIFSNAQKQYNCYYLDIEPRERTIFCKGIIFYAKK